MKFEFFLKIYCCIVDLQCCIKKFKFNLYFYLKIWQPYMWLNLVFFGSSPQKRIQISGPEHLCPLTTLGSLVWVLVVRAPAPR